MCFAKLLLSQVVETVIACRGAGIIHRDIKVGDNFFSSRFVAKVGECGMADDDSVKQNQN